MRIFTFLLLALFASFSINAQVVVVNSPASIQSAYVWSTGFGADLLSDVWTGDCVIMDDGTDPVTDGCEQTTQDYTGLIVLIDRGTCEFGLKSLQAEMVGALAVVILNNVAGGVVGLGAGAVGGQVTIPVVMLSLDDGNLIKDVINGGTTVNMTIGNLQFDNDISSTEEDVRNPLVGTIPQDQIAFSNYGSFAPAVRVNNNGLMDATNVTADCIINWTPDGGSSTEVYNESGSEDLIIADTGFAVIQLPEFDFSTSGVGNYDYSSTIDMDATDELDFDNDVTGNFSISPNVFSKGNWDFDNNRPAFTTGFGAGAGDIEFFTGLEIPIGVGHRIDSVTFYVSTGADNLANISINVNLYKWDDLNNDTIIDQADGEIARVALATHTFSTDETENNSWVTKQLLDNVTLSDGYLMPEDNGQYIIGTQYIGGETMFFGFNGDYSQQLNFDDNTIVTDMELPYFFTQTFANDLPDWDALSIFSNTQAATTTAVYVNNTVSGTTILTDDLAKISLFPNPVSNTLNAEVTLDEQTSELTYRIIDFQGKVITRVVKDNVTNDTNAFDVSSLASGQYTLTIQTDKGVKTEKFSVAH